MQLLWKDRRAAQLPGTANTMSFEVTIGPGRPTQEPKWKRRSLREAQLPRQSNLTDLTGPMSRRWPGSKITSQRIRWHDRKPTDGPFRGSKMVATSTCHPLRSGGFRASLVHCDCYVVFEEAYYSAPFRLVGQQVWVHWRSPGPCRSSANTPRGASTGKARQTAHEPGPS